MRARATAAVSWCAALGTSALLLAGCASMPRSVRQQFSDSYRCPYDTVLVVETGYRPTPEQIEFNARGCDHEVFYNCRRIDMHRVVCSPTRY